MKVTCAACSTRFGVNDDLVRGKFVKFRCRKCGEMIPVNGGALPLQQDSPSPPSVSLESPEDIPVVLSDVPTAPPTPVRDYHLSRSEVTPTKPGLFPSGHFPFPGSSAAPKELAVPPSPVLEEREARAVVVPNEAPSLVPQPSSLAPVATVSSPAAALHTVSSLPDRRASSLRGGSRRHLTWATAALIVVGAVGLRAMIPPRHAPGMSASSAPGETVGSPAAGTTAQAPASEPAEPVASPPPRMLPEPSTAPDEAALGSEAPVQAAPAPAAQPSNRAAVNKPPAKRGADRLPESTFPPVPASAQANPAPAVDLAPEFNRDVALESLASAISDLSSCKELEGPTGQARVAITFAPSGKVTTASIEGPPFNGTSSGSCIAAKLRSARVPPFSGGNVTVHRSISID